MQPEMVSFFLWLAANPYVLLFAVALGAVLLGKVTLKGFGLGMVGSAIVLGAAISALSSACGVRMDLDGVARSIFFCLFIYAFGLRLGPSLLHVGKGDGPKLAALAAICAVLGLVLSVAFEEVWHLPAGAAGGILAGSMTMPAAIGAAEEAVRQGAMPLPPGARFEDVSGMIALSFGLTYLWATVGIVAICRYVPHWWGLDAKAEAKAHENALGVDQVDEAGLTGYRPLVVRAYRLANDRLTGWTVRHFVQAYPHYTVLNVLRPEPARRASGSHAARTLALQGEASFATAGPAGIAVLREPDATLPPPFAAKSERGVLPSTQYSKLGAAEGLAFRQGDIVTIGARIEHHAQGAAALGPEVGDEAALNVPLDAGAILVTKAQVEGLPFGDLRDGDFARQIAIVHLERGGVPMPLGVHVKLQRGDVLFASGVKSAVEKLAAMIGRIVRPNATADLVIVATGMLLGLALGSLELPLAGAHLGFGYAGGLLISGLLVSCLATRLEHPGYAPSVSRNLLEDLGLVLFVAIVGIHAGTALATQLTPELATQILIAGFVVATLPPLAAWAIGIHVLKINPAILQGALAGTRSHPAAALESVRESGSNVPWIGFPVAYAVSGLLLTAFGYVAMVLSR